MTDQPLLELVDLRAGYRLRRNWLRRGPSRVTVVADVNLRLPAGRTLGIVGESGCGKSTLGRTIVGLLRPWSGEVRYDGRDIGAATPKQLRGLRRDVQMVLQNPFASLNPRMTVGELVSEGWRIHPGIVARSEWDAEIARLLDQVGLRPEHANRRPHEFSGGQRQRICIARALALRPRLIVCDEIVSALDVSIRAQILNLLQDLQDELGISYLFIAHDLDVVRHFAHDTAVMYLGTVVENGPTEQIFTAPSHPYTQALLSAAPTVDDWRPDRPAELVLSGETPSPTHPPTGCRFRTRCPKAADLCATDVPTLVERGTGHPVACHFAEVDLAVTGRS
ncbi:MAG: ATP-binding cassette domain-containing protein [Streptosporangiales bacterium]|nr:ATP-binding cassette domain-containing protein [Streptosporangiales bacterium]